MEQAESEPPGLELSVAQVCSSQAEADELEMLRELLNSRNTGKRAHYLRSFWGAQGTNPSDIVDYDFVAEEAPLRSLKSRLLERHELSVAERGLNADATLTVQTLTGEEGKGSTLTNKSPRSEECPDKIAHAHLQVTRIFERRGHGAFVQAPNKGFRVDADKPRAVTPQLLKAKRASPCNPGEVHSNASLLTPAPQVIEWARKHVAQLEIRRTLEYSPTMPDYLQWTSISGIQTKTAKRSRNQHPSKSKQLTKKLQSRYEKERAARFAKMKATQKFFDDLHAEECARQVAKKIASKAKLARIRKQMSNTRLSKTSGVDGEKASDNNQNQVQRTSPARLSPLKSMPPQSSESGLRVSLVKVTKKGKEKALANNDKFRKRPAPAPGARIVAQKPSVRQSVLNKSDKNGPGKTNMGCNLSERQSRISKLSAKTNAEQDVSAASPVKKKIRSESSIAKVEFVQNKVQAALKVGSQNQQVKGNPNAKTHTIKATNASKADSKFPARSEKTLQSLKKDERRSSTSKNQVKHTKPQIGASIETKASSLPQGTVKTKKAPEDKETRQVKPEAFGKESLLPKAKSDHEPETKIKAKPEARPKAELELNSKSVLECTTKVELDSELTNGSVSEPAANLAEPEAKAVNEPVAKQVAEPEARRVATPEVRPVAESKDEPKTKVVDEPSDKPVAKPELRPVEPEVKPIAESKDEPETKALDEPVDKPVAEPGVRPVAKSEEKLDIKAVDELSDEPEQRPEQMPRAKPESGPLPKSKVKPESGSLLEPVPEPVPEPVSEHVPEPVPKPLVEPVSAPVCEPVPEPVLEPVLEHVSELVPEPKAELGAGPKVELENEVNPASEAKSVSSKDIDSELRPKLEEGAIEEPAPQVEQRPEAEKSIPDNDQEDRIQAPNDPVAQPPNSETKAEIEVTTEATIQVEASNDESQEGSPSQSQDEDVNKPEPRPEISHEASSGSRSTPASGPPRTPASRGSGARGTVSNASTPATTVLRMVEGMGEVDVDGGFEVAEIIGEGPWYQRYDEGSGYYYYENSETGETSWDAPEVFVSLAYRKTEELSLGLAQDGQAEQASQEFSPPVDIIQDSELTAGGNSDWAEGGIEADVYKDDYGGYAQQGEWMSAEIAPQEDADVTAYDQRMIGGYDNYGDYQYDDQTAEEQTPVPVPARKKKPSVKKIKGYGAVQADYSI